MDGTPGLYPCTIKTNLGVSPAITPQGIAIFNCLPVSVMLCNDFRIIELDYYPIKKYFSITSDPMEQSNLKRLTSS